MDIDTLDAQLTRLAAEEAALTARIEQLEQQPVTSEADQLVYSSAGLKFRQFSNRRMDLERQRVEALAEQQRARDAAHQAERDKLRKADAAKRAQSVKLTRANAALILERQAIGKRLAELDAALPGEDTPDPVAEALDNSAGALILTAALLEAVPAADKSLTLIDKTKLVALDGVPPQSVGLVEDYCQALVSSERQAAARRQVEQIAKDGTKALEAVLRSYPVASGVNGSWAIRLERAGVSQAALNRVHRLAMQTVHPEPDAPPVVTVAQTSPPRLHLNGLCRLCGPVAAVPGGVQPVCPKCGSVVMPLGA